MEDLKSDSGDMQIETRNIESDKLKLKSSSTEYTKTLNDR